MLDKIIEEIKDLLVAVGVADQVEFSIPPKPEMGDFAFPCFGLAKSQGKNPVEVAKNLESRISDLELPDVIERVQTFGPYVNFFLSTPQLAKMVIGEIVKTEEKYGMNEEGKKHKVLIEYPSNNTHKEFHIGHFRNVCIGNTLVQLYQAGGYMVYPVNYLNDFGSHVAKCLWGLQKFHAGENAPENKQKWLGEIYAEASGYVKDHPEVAGEVAETQKKLEAEDASIWKLFLDTRQWSLNKFEELFKELGVQHKAVFYEKDIKKKGQKIVDELLKKGIAEVGERGAIIIDLKKYNLDVALLRKADGTGLYLTSDLPLAEEKFKKFKVDEAITITGQEQNFYFRQLFKILELMDFKKKTTHIGYGLVQLPEGKMSSRSGNVILYEDLRDQVFERMYTGTKERHADWSEKKIIETARKLAMAALKFDMQKHEAAKNIVFDINEATAVEGFSGPYALYVVARINSLIKKSEIRDTKFKINFELLAAPEEKKVVMLIADYPEVIKKALRQYNPSVIARYVFDVAQGFNEFYNKQSVLNAETVELVTTRLGLSQAVKQVLENALDVLTIETVEEM